MPQSEIQRITLGAMRNYVNGSWQEFRPIMAGYGPFRAVQLDDGVSLAAASLLASRLQTVFTTDEPAFSGKASVSGDYGSCGMGRFAVADANSLSIADAAGLRPGDGDFAVACWFITDDLGTRNPVAKWSGAADWHVQMNPNGSIQLAVFGDSGGTVASAVTAAGVIEAGTLYFIYADYQHSTKAIRISVNDGSFATGTGGWTTRGSANAALKIGEIGTLGRYWNGLIGPVGYWIGRRLSAGEITSLYNGGVPKGYADLTSGEKASLAGWWGMTSPATLTTDESGNGRTLTNNNSVTWGEGSIVLTATFDASLDDLPEMTIGGQLSQREEFTVGGASNESVQYSDGSDGGSTIFDQFGVITSAGPPYNYDTVGVGTGSSSVTYRSTIDGPRPNQTKTSGGGGTVTVDVQGLDPITVTVETIQNGEGVSFLAAFAANSNQVSSYA